MYNINSNYSSNVQQKNNPSFGYLYMDEDLITKKLGEYAGKAAKKARPALEEIGKVVDVFVQPEVSETDSIYNVLSVFVQRITQIAPKSENRIKNCFNGIKEFLQINLKHSVSSDVFINFFNVGYHLVEEAEKGKNLILQSNK